MFNFFSFSLPLPSGLPVFTNFIYIFKPSQMHHTSTLKYSSFITNTCSISPTYWTDPLRHTTMRSKSEDQSSHLCPRRVLESHGSIVRSTCRWNTWDPPNAKMGFSTPPRTLRNIFSSCCIPHHPVEHSISHDDCSPKKNRPSLHCSWTNTCNLDPHLPVVWCCKCHGAVCGRNCRPNANWLGRPTRTCYISIQQTSPMLESLWSTANNRSDPKKNTTRRGSGCGWGWTTWCVSP